MASITFNHGLRVNGCKIIEGAKGMFLSYPSEKKAGTDQFFPLMHPVNRQLSENIQSEVIRKYMDLIA